MIIKVNGRLTKRNQKLKKSHRFTIVGETKPEQWEEFFEKLKALLDKFGLKLKKA
jgi:hypothetical protein